MNSNEHQRIASRSDWYLNEQLDIDKRLIRFRYETIKPELVGPKGLEMGSAEGQMTRYLIEDFDQLTVVEGSFELLSKIPDNENIVKIHSLFEDFQPTERFNSIIMEHILEHVDNPVALLQLVKQWLAPGGRIFIGVPNGNSFHRLVAVKMGLLHEPCQLNDRDLAVGHRRVYTMDALKVDIAEAGLTILHIGGVYFKPLSNGQMQEHWSKEMIQGFYELGKEFPENAADIYAICCV